MRLNWISYYLQYNGFGRFSAKLVQALQTFGIDVKHLTIGDLEKPQWMLDQLGVDWNNLNFTCLDLAQITKVPGRHWFYTMCEGTRLLKSQVKKMKKANIERIVVPSQFCADAFMDSGVHCPVSIVHLGTDPAEFPLAPQVDRPYTFLALADRGSRKGWEEVYYGFYKAFGGKTDGVKDVRLIIKSLPNSNHTLKLIANRTGNMDSRISIDMKRYDDIADFYRQGDCFVIPSKSEGWGMPHREAAMMGLPVIVQPIDGLDDGNLHKWAKVLPPGYIEDIPADDRWGGNGSWMTADPRRVGEEMYDCYTNREDARAFGLLASTWLAGHQTYLNSAANLLDLIVRETGYGSQMDNPTYNAISANGGGFHRSSASVG